MPVNAHKEIAEQWFAAFNQHDLEALISLYHDQARHYSPKLKMRQPDTGGWVSGKEQLRNWWRDAFDRLPQLHYIPVSFTIDESGVFLEYQRQTPGEPDMSIAEKLDIQDGLITGSRVYHG